MKNKKNFFSESDDEENNQSHLLTGIGERLSQFISNSPIENKDSVVNYILKLKECVTSTTTSTNSIITNHNINYKDAINSMKFSFLNSEVEDFLKNISDDLFIVTHINISRKPLNKFNLNNKKAEELIKEIKDESKKFKLLDLMGNITTNGFEQTYRHLLKRKAKSFIQNTNNNDFSVSSNNNKNPFEDSLVTMYKGTRLRLVSKEKVVFLDADYNQIINQERFDVLNLLFLISSAIVVNCLHIKDDNSGTNKNLISGNPMLNFFNKTNSESSFKIVDNFIETMKESFKTNLQFKVRLLYYVLFKFRIQI